MTGLVEFLRARADEEDNEIRICRDLELAPGQVGGEIGTWTPDGYWDRALAGVEAKRAVVAHAEHWAATLHATPEGWTEETCTAYRMAMEWTLRHLATPHAGHPDYDEEWTP